MNYIVATVKNWNIEVFKKTISKYPGNWHLISDPSELNLNNLNKIKPRYIFFPHWSEIVAASILNSYECVCFHETDLPYGRGGSPIQNLILAGNKKSKLSALRMISKLDAGPIYLKKNIVLTGSAQEIYKKNAKIVAQMIKEIITKNPVPKEQSGKIINFKRRKSEQSNLLENEFASTEQIYDFIRMLDADSYPKAFVKIGKFRLEFFDAVKKGAKISALVTIKNDSRK